MTLTLVETAASASANTYVTLAEAEAFILTLTFSPTWTGKSNDQKCAALINAARLMNTMGWKGVRSTQAQALAWPRVEGGWCLNLGGFIPNPNGYLYDSDGFPVPSDSVPQCIKDAQCMFALALLKEDRTADAGGMSQEKLSIGSLTIENQKRNMIPAVVYDLCGQFLASGPGRVRTERA